MTRKTLKLGIDLFDADCLYYGIGEYEYCLGNSLCLKAKEWAEKKGVEIYLLVKDHMVGAFGLDVKYVALTKRRMRLINGVPFLKHFLLPRFDLIHFTHQLPRLHVRVAPKTLVTIHNINFIHGSFSRFAKYRKQRRYQHYFRF